MYRSIILLLPILFLSSKTFAQQVLIPSYEKNLTIVNDSLSDGIMELLPYPSDSLYKHQWNTTDIRYQNYPFVGKNDTIQIGLVGDANTPYVHPYKGRVLSRFGMRSGRMHTGIDVKLNLGDSVLCAFDGQVRLAKRFSGYGNLVLVRHHNGLETLYAHLQKIDVKVGDILNAGDLIGKGGRTGRATTEHLHFETRIFGEPFNPEKYIDFDNYILKCDSLYYKDKQVVTSIDKIKGNPTSIKTAVAKTENSTDSIHHVIQKGDTLWQISKMYNTSVEKICGLNNISPNQTLQVGSVLNIR